MAPLQILVVGSINIDVILHVDAFAKPGETVLAERHHMACGGKGANQAVAAARACRDPGLRVVMASAVGEDSFARMALDNLAANRVDTQLVRTTTEPTGCAFIAVDRSGENTIVVAGGANRAVRASHVPDALLSQSALVVLQMEIPIEETIAVAARTKRLGRPVLLNLAPVPDTLSTVQLAALLAVTDILVANEGETCAARTRFTGKPGDDPEAAMAEIATTRGLTGIVTLGAGGATALFPDGSRLHAPTPPVTVVDTTGAGDTFVGILAAGLAESRPFDAALKRACRGASLACLALGAQAGMPDADALDRE